MHQEQAIIVGAGPAGLTAAYELLVRTGIKPIVLEKSDCVGGISRTVNYKGNRIDIGGHRFFSKSDRVMSWWLETLPALAPGDDPARVDRIMLLRPRKSRIYYLRRFFDYPIILSRDTILKLEKTGRKNGKNAEKTGQPDPCILLEQRNLIRCRGRSHACRSLFRRTAPHQYRPNRRDISAMKRSSP